MSKPSLTLDEQVSQLIERGLQVRNTDQLRDFLYDHSYYRLSGYWRYFQVAPHQGDNRFREGTTLEDIQEVVAFDTALRTYLMQGISTVEVVVRSRLAYEMSRLPFGVEGYRYEELYRQEISSRGVDIRRALLDSIEGEIERANEVSVKKYRDSGGVIPIWVAADIFSFGTLSKMYRLLDNEPVREKIAQELGMKQTRWLSTNLHALSVLRNVCAHHGRIWNRVITMKPLIVHRLIEPGSHFNATPWGWILVLSDLVTTIKRSDGYKTKLFSFLEQNKKFEPGIKHPYIS